VHRIQRSFGIWSDIRREEDAGVPPHRVPVSEVTILATLLPFLIKRLRYSMPLSLLSKTISRNLATTRPWNLKTIEKQPLNLHRRFSASIEDNAFRFKRGEF